MNAVVEMPSRAPALMGGAHVSAIVPRSIEEMWRVSNMVVRAGLAPASLIANKSGEDAVSAVAVAIMSGAELGMKPMAALRSFTVINGKPALYGDGLINVIRASGKAAYLRTGCDTRNGQLVGWCEAKRSDTGEEKRVEFSQADAMRAGLWSDKARITKRRKDGGTYEADNDSPWFKYPQRMLPWRASGYCLRELFADVLGGIADEFEVSEITNRDEPVSITPPSPMRPPSPSAIAAPVEEAEIVDEREIVSETGEQASEFVADESDVIDAAAFFEDLETRLSGAMDAETVEEIWTELDPDGTFDGDDLNLEIAHKIKVRRLTQIHPINAG